MPLERKKLTKETRSYVRSESGEIKEELHTQELYVNNEPNYVKMYLQDVLQLSGLPKAHHDILLCVLKEMNWQNRVYLSGALKKNLIAQLGIQVTTFAKALEKFVAEEILFREAVGVYLVNPYLFGKGNWKDIKAIRLTVNYQGNKKEIKAEMKYNKAAA